MRATAMVKDIDVAGIQLGCSIKSGGGGFGLARRQLRHSEPHQSLSVAPIDLALAPQRGNGIWIVVGAIARNPQKEVSPWEPGRKRNGAVEGADRFWQMAVLQLRQS